MLTNFDNSSANEFTESEDDSPNYLRKFIASVNDMNPREKIAQIGIEPSVLGIPSDGPSYEKMRTIFAEIPFDYWINANFPKPWLDLSSIGPADSRLQTLPDYTLFFIFYCQVKDNIQVLAAKELESRGWKYIDYKWTYQTKTEYKTFNVNNWTIEQK